MHVPYVQCTCTRIMCTYVHDPNYMYMYMHLHDCTSTVQASYVPIPTLALHTQYGTAMPGLSHVL